MAGSLLKTTAESIIRLLNGYYVGQSEDGLTLYLESGERHTQERGSEMDKWRVVKRGECCLENGTKNSGKAKHGIFSEMGHFRPQGMGWNEMRPRI